VKEMAYIFPLDVTVRLRSESKEFINYAKLYLGGFHECLNQCLDESTLLSSTVRFEECDPVYSKNSKEAAYLSRSVSFVDNKLIAKTGHSSVAIEIKSEDNLEITIIPRCQSTRFKTMALKYAKMLIGKKTTIDKNHQFQKLLRQAIHLPVLSNYMYRGYTVGHGSAFIFNNTGVIIFGAGGLGKTTLCLSIVGQIENGRWLTDNYVVLSDGVIISFPEPYRIDNRIGVNIGSCADKPTFKVNNRVYYIPDKPDSYCQQIDRLVLIQLKRGGGAKFEKMSIFKAWTNFISTTLTLGDEFPYSTYFGFFGYLPENAFIPIIRPVMPEFKKMDAWSVCIPECTIASEYNRWAKAFAREIYNNTI